MLAAVTNNPISQQFSIQEACFSLLYNLMSTVSSPGQLSTQVATQGFRLHLLGESALLGSFACERKSLSAYLVS